jgi:hypothetical protein
MEENVEPSKPSLKDRVTEKYIQIKERVMLNTVKDHVEKHKTAYYIGGIVVVAGVVYIVTRRRYDVKLTFSPSVTELMNKLKVTGNWKPEVHANLIKINVHDTGRPGYLTRSIEFDKYFPTQTETARTFGVSNSTLSRHLNGHIPDAKGLHFERFAV